MINEVAPYAPSCWSDKAQRLFNLGTFAHFKACDIEHELPRIIDEQIVIFPTPRAAWYSQWSTRLYAAFAALPAEETPDYWLNEGGA